MATPTRADPPIASSPASRRYIPDDIEYLNVSGKKIDDEEVKLLAEELAGRTLTRRKRNCWRRNWHPTLR
jgi:hypothetical protein